MSVVTQHLTLCVVSCLCHWVEAVEHGGSKIEGDARRLLHTASRVLVLHYSERCPKIIACSIISGTPEFNGEERGEKIDLGNIANGINALERREFKQFVMQSCIMSLLSS